MTLDNAQNLVDKWINKYGVRYFSELTNLAQLMEEVGELSRIMSRKFGEQSYKLTDTKGNISDELTDVLFVLICIANQTGVNLTEALERNLIKKTKRDSTRHKKNKKLKS